MKKPLKEAFFDLYNSGGLVRKALIMLTLMSAAIGAIYMLADLFS